MKQHSLRAWCVVLFVLFLTACGGGTQTAEPTATPEVEATTPPVEATATKAPTATPEPTEVPEPTETPEPTATPEPEGEAIAYGDTVRGSIDEEGAEVTYIFEGVEDESVQVMIETVRGQMEPTLSLYDSDETLLATSEATGDFSAKMDYTLEADGTYSIVVAGLGGDTGTYELTIANAQTGGTLEYGDIVTGVLDDETFEGVWEFAGSAGDFVNIAVLADDEDLDTRIDLYYEGDTFVASDDDTNELNPEIAGYPLLQDGTYTIIVSVVGGEGEGSYTLGLDQSDGVTGTIELDVPIEGEIEEGSHLYTFEGEEGQEISIMVDAGEGSELDPYVALFSPSGVLVASDDDSGEGSNSLIREATLPESGTYSIVISAYSREGAFILTLGAALEPVSAGAVAYDAPVQGELVGNQEQAWTFDAQPGDVVTIAVNSAEDATGLDVRVALVDPDGTELTSDDDSGGDSNALIEGYPLVRAGTYTLVVSAFSGEGSYDLTITSETAASLAIGDTVSGEVTEDGFLSWTFEGQEGDVITLSAARGEDVESLDLYIAVLGPDGETLDSDDDSAGDLNPEISGLPLPTSGIYLVVVASVSGEGAFTLTVVPTE